MSFAKDLSLLEREHRATWDGFAPLPTELGYVMRLVCVECGVHAYQMTKDAALAGKEVRVRCANCVYNHEDFARGRN